MKIDPVRTYAMSLEAVTEEPHHNFSSFRVRGKIFVTIPPDEQFVHVFLDEEDRERALALYPDFTEKLLWGAKVLGVRVSLAAATPAAVKSLVGQAYAARVRKDAGPKKPVTGHRIFTMPFAKVYPMYVQKAERKGRTKAEVDQVIRWLTGYSQAALQKAIKQEVDFETFFAQAPALNPNVSLIQGLVCGVRVEEVEDPLMQKIRYLDKLVDELAKGKAMEKILRS